MAVLSMTDIDEITMRLVHYFVTKENYQPIVVNGIENEIWLENIDADYKVIRINGNYIHNNDQLDYDVYKAKSIIKQIKRKMLTLSCNSLNILLNIGDNVKIDDEFDVKNMEICVINDSDELNTDSSLTDLFPEIKNDVIDATSDMDFFINVTKDINQSTEKKNRLYEKTFKKKTIVVTYGLIIINCIIFLLQMAGILNPSLFVIDKVAIINGEYWRLITAAFFHVDILHLLCNMYSLYIVGTELETVLGKVKYITIYLLSAIMCSLFSAVLLGAAARGASGAIFGLIGAMLYFGYHYRLYLGNVMMSQLVPIIVLNLFLGLMIPGIDNYGHIGGLIGGLFAGMIVGVEGKSESADKVNGVIVYIIMAAFFAYMLFR